MVRVPSILFRRPMHFEEFTAPECFPDLHLDQIVDAIAPGDADDQLARFFYAPRHDVADIHFRHEVFRDLERDVNRQPIQAFVDAMRSVRTQLQTASRIWHPLQKQGWFVHAVRAYCKALTALDTDLTGSDISSQGLRDIADYVTDYVDSDRFRRLVDETGAVHTELGKIRYTVHIQGLRVHVDEYDGETDYSADVAEVFERFRRHGGRDYHVRQKDYAEMNHVEEQILVYVSKLYPDTFALLADFCERNRTFIDSTIARFDREAQFYLSYLAFMGRFTPAGLKFSYPEVTAGFEGVYVEDAFDLALAVKLLHGQEPVVRNDFRLSGPERIFVVTGPNQGGKTTLARTVGQIAYLAALGCPVPASRAKVTLPDEIFTHFERQESLATLRGKLENELVRIHETLSRASSRSVIVMNESFASTTVDDAALIGTEVLERIIALGCVAVYVTFLDELASLDPACVSMVGEVESDDPTQRTFHFTRRPADGLAYAAALADKYGLSREVLRERIAQ